MQTSLEALKPTKPKSTQPFLPWEIIDEILKIADELLVAVNLGRFSIASSLRFPYRSSMGKSKLVKVFTREWSMLSWGKY
jgi:hypothetical protein